MPRYAKSDPRYKPYAENRSTTRNERSRLAERKSEARSITFVAWDGEGSTIENDYTSRVPFLLPDKTINPDFDLSRNEHRYNLLVNSTGPDAWIYEESGLDTLQCFEFFIRTEKRLRAQKKKCVHVIFSGGYDMNMIFKNLPRAKLEQLQKKGWSYWYPYEKGSGCYKIEWFPRKMLILTWLPRKKNPGEKRAVPGTTQFVLFDVWGFFQTSFLRTIDDFETTIHFPEYAIIQEGKAARGSFSGAREDMTGATLTYCQAELSALVRIMEALNAALVEAEMEIRSWHGPGAIASVVLKKHQVPEHYAELPASVQIAVETAFFGGRIEMLKIGHTEKPVYDYDVRSCYPSAMPKLVSLAGGYWYRILDPEYQMSDMTLYRVRWMFPADWPFYPFPFRYPDQTIVYPCEGEGWYHSPEIQAVMRAVPNWQDYMEIIDGWTYQPPDDVVYPMAFVAEYYKIRAKLKKAGNRAQMAFKLALNSLYGKLAQKVGYDKEKGIEKSLPFLNLLYAGFITSHGRAMLFELAMHNPAAIIAFQTDGVFTEQMLPAKLSEELGDWELTVVEHGYTCCQAGVYFFNSLNKQGELVHHAKYRGFSKDAFTMDKIHQAWQNDQWSLPDERQMFKTLGGCLMGERLKYWTQWLPTRKDLDITGGNNKRRGYPTYLSGKKLVKQLVPLAVASNKFPGLCSAKKIYPWDEDYRERMQAVLDSIEAQEEEYETEAWHER